MKKFLLALLFLYTLTMTLTVRAAPKTEKSLYERLGGVFAIAMVADHFSDAVATGTAWPVVFPFKTRRLFY